MARKLTNGRKRAAKYLQEPVANAAVSERVVAIPRIAVFSELPFAQIGMIGGKEPPQARSDTGDQPAISTKVAKSAKTAKPAIAPKGGRKAPQAKRKARAVATSARRKAK